MGDRFRRPDAAAINFIVRAPASTQHKRAPNTSAGLITPGSMEGVREGTPSQLLITACTEQTNHQNRSKHTAWFRHALSATGAENTCGHLVALGMDSPPRHWSGLIYLTQGQQSTNQYPNQFCMVPHSFCKFLRAKPRIDRPTARMCNSTSGNRRGWLLLLHLPGPSTLASGCRPSFQFWDHMGLPAAIRWSAVLSSWRGSTARKSLFLFLPRSALAGLCQRRGFLFQVPTQWAFWAWPQSILSQAINAAPTHWCVRRGAPASPSPSSSVHAGLVGEDSHFSFNSSGGIGGSRRSFIARRCAAIWAGEAT